MLGHNIKKHRKLKKLTLEQLAGTQMTKGMLSLIENNKAKPSLENLEYIASQLDITVSELLNDTDNQSLKNLLNAIESLEDPNYILVEETRKELIDKIKPYLTSISTNYESARICQIYAGCLYYDKDENYHYYLKQSINIYEQLNITTKQLEIQLNFINIDFLNNNFEKAYYSIKQLYETMDKLYSHVEPISKLEIAFHYAAFAFTLGKLDEGFSVIDDALKFSAKHELFYYTGNMYRLAACCDVIYNHNSNSKYLKKLQLFGEFADDTRCLNIVNVLKIYTILEIDHKYEEALVLCAQEIAKLEAISQVIEDKSIKRNAAFALPLCKMLKGGALYYLERFEEAIDIFTSITFEAVNFPMDIDDGNLANYYLAKAYLATNQIELAKNTIEMALEKIKPYPYMKTRNLLEQLQIE